MVFSHLGEGLVDPWNLLLTSVIIKTQKNADRPTQRQACMPEAATHWAN